MAVEKKQGFFSRYFAARHSGCCDMKIEAVSEEASAAPEARGAVLANQKAGKVLRRASCCCGDDVEKKSGGGCCG